MQPLRVGLIGTGVISDIYLTTCQKFEILDVVACGSLDLEESRRKAEKYHIPSGCSPDEIIDDPDIDCVLNLTIPAAHAASSGLNRCKRWPFFSVSLPLPGAAFFHWGSEVQNTGGKHVQHNLGTARYFQAG